MTIQQALLSAIKKLQKKKIDSPHLDAEVLLAFILNKTRSYLLAHHQQNVTARQLKKYSALISRRQHHVPTAYLTNQKEFYGLNFYVSTDVLVPRPETEVLVEETIKCARQLHQTISYKPLAICDVGTGSGCIAITLAKYLPHAKITATDISEKALTVAKKNARTHKVLKKIRFLAGDLLRPLILKKIKCDIIVANPPYLTRAEIKNVRHEPKMALYGGKMGMEVIERLLMQSTEVLNENGVILLEISPTQTKLVDFIVEQQLPGRKVTFIKDLNGRNRVVKIE